MSRRVALLCSLTSLLLTAGSLRAAAAPSEDWPAPQADEAGVLRPAAWLGIARVDATGRRPFRPDAVLREHVLPGRPPRVGDALSGELGEEQAWERRAAEENGGPGGGVGWAYTALHVDAPRVVLARVSGASTLWINGEAFAGDVYRFGNDGVPVSLLAGRNDVYVTGIRGAFGFALMPVDGPLTIGARDLTVPDLVAGGRDVGPLGLLVLNTSTGTSASLHVSAPGDAVFAPLDHTVRGLGPLGLRKLHVPLSLRAGAAVPDDGLDTWTRLVRVRDPISGASAEHTVSFRVVSPTAPRRVTFRSEVDGSAQFWALRPVDPDADDGGHDWPEHLVLSTHGAGVDALAQARCYAPRPDRWVAAPTNRRPFGFDWQDWGRLDAYEVLDEALALSGVDRRRVAVTGHSMGGHGAWHLAANDADGFSAVAPSAGWESFDSYGGRPEGVLRELWHHADQPSKTLDQLSNLAAMPVFILHGDADSTVPLSEAETMRAALRDVGAEPGWHAEPGKGHWWNGGASPGTDCLDWPELAELLATSEIADDPDELRFTTAGPHVDDQHHWLRITDSDPRFTLTGAAANWSGDDELVIEPSNARALEILPRPGRRLQAIRFEELESNGMLRRQRISLADLPEGRSTLEGHWERRVQRVSVRDGHEFQMRWSAVDEPTASEQAGAQARAFKLAFDREFVLVPGTAGDARETRALAARARYDAQVWWYRGNGRAEIATDAEFLAGDFSGRHVILYGNADTNAAWARVLGDGGPLDARRGALVIREDDVVTRGPLVGDGRSAAGARLIGEDLAGVWVRPRLDDPGTLVGVFADTGVQGTRLGFAVPTFVSGVGLPSWTLFDGAVLERGDRGVQAAGWFWSDGQLLPAAPFDDSHDTWPDGWL